MLLAAYGAAGDLETHKSSPHHRHRRARLCRAAARGGVRRGRPARRRRRYSSERVAQLRDGNSYIEDIPSERLQAVSGRIEATTRATRLGLCDAIIICVPTPLTANREPDLGPLLNASQAVADVLQPGQLVVLESTTYPGTTRERVLPILEETGLVAGRDVNLAFSPERVDPGNETHSLRNTPKIIGGLTRECRDRAEAVYGLICEQVVPVSTPEVAEMAKLLENIFRSVNIALVNELARLADRMQIDIHEVIDAAATKPFGFMRSTPAGAWRPLPPGRPLLPVVEGARTRLRDRVHRARGQGQPEPAVLLRRAGRARAERPGQGRQGLPDRGRRRRLQGRHRRHPRIAGAEDHRPAAGTRCRRRLHGPLRPGAPRLGAHGHHARRSARRR